MSRLGSRSPAAGADPLAAAGPAPPRRLDDAAAAPAPPLRPRTPRRRRLRALATNLGEVCGLAAVLLLPACGDGEVDGASAGEVELVAEGEDFHATLCFPAADGLLRCEPRAIPAAGSVEETAAAIVQALIDGPGPTEETLPALPPAAGLQAFDLVAGVAYVDLTVAQAGPALRFERPAMGLREELLAVYSLVNSLTASNLGIERVVLMWNGEQRLTFAGHVDTTRPLLPDLDRNAQPAADL